MSCNVVAPLVASLGASLRYDPGHPAVYRVFMQHRRSLGASLRYDPSHPATQPAENAER